MLTYWFIFLYPAWNALVRTRAIYSQFYAWCLSLALALIIGFRFEVGGDWGNYLRGQSALVNTSFEEVIQNTLQDPGYELLSWLSLQLGAGIYGVNFVCALIFSIGLVFFCRAQPRPWLALAISIPYLVIVVAMGYTRQSVAIGIGMLALTALERHEIKKFLALVFMASTFHKTAFVMSLLVMTSSNSRQTISSKSTRLLISFLAALSLGYTFFAPRIEQYLLGYDQQVLQSQGAAIRVVMCAIPALIFLLFPRRFSLPKNVRSIWKAISFVAIACLAALFLLKSSTVVDRIALYCIPLQMFVGARISSLNIVDVDKKTITISVLLAALSVQFIWLNFAANSGSWLPYKNILTI